MLGGRPTAREMPDRGSQPREGAASSDRLPAGPAGRVRQHRPQFDRLRPFPDSKWRENFAGNKNDIEKLGTCRFFIEKRETAETVFRSGFRESTPG